MRGSKAVPVLGMPTETLRHSLSIDEATPAAEGPLPAEDHVEALQVVQHHRGAPELSVEGFAVQG